MWDLRIDGGTVVDGTGCEARTADVAIENGRIAAVGRDLGAARRTIDADGLLVTPGWVDVHTHYDGQASWDSQMAPSLWHGVTTVVMGNCGVGFAPAAPERREWLIGLMEGVEDIPAPALHAGMPWDWESFPEYLDALGRLPRTIDVAGQLTHGALRAYVMGERGAKNQAATPDDLERMAALAREAVLAGALGFSSSRTLVHVGSDGEPVPGTFASEDELVAIARGVRRTGRGLLEMVLRGVAGEDVEALTRETEMLGRIALASDCPITFLLIQNNVDGEQWRTQLDVCADAVKRGARLTPQVFGRPVCILFSAEGENPFQYLPSYAPLKNLPLAERLAAMRRPEVREKLLSEKDPNETGMSLLYKSEDTWRRTYPMGRPLSYTPAAGSSIADVAAREGRRPLEVVYDRLTANDGREFLMYAVAGYANGNPDALFEMMRHPMTALGGSDAGAHLRQIIDASVHTYMLTEWVRDHEKGDRHHLPLEQVVHMLSGSGAKLFGMPDRGTLEPGKKADVNLIDLSRLALDHPTMVYDMPAGMPRLMQTAKGYVATLVAGEAVQEHGRETGARPGKVVRGGA